MSESSALTPRVAGLIVEYRRTLDELQDRSRAIGTTKPSAAIAPLQSSLHAWMVSAKADIVQLPTTVSIKTAKSTVQKPLYLIRQTKTSFSRLTLTQLGTSVDSLSSTKLVAAYEHMRGAWARSMEEERTRRTMQRERRGWAAKVVAASKAAPLTLTEAPRCVGIVWEGSGPPPEDDEEEEEEEESGKKKAGKKRTRRSQLETAKAILENEPDVDTLPPLAETPPVIGWNSVVATALSQDARERTRRVVSQVLVTPRATKVHLAHGVVTLAKDDPQVNPGTQLWELMERDKAARARLRLVRKETLGPLKERKADLEGALDAPLKAIDPEGVGHVSVRVKGPDGRVQARPLTRRERPGVTKKTVSLADFSESIVGDALASWNNRPFVPEEVPTQWAPSTRREVFTRLQAAWDAYTQSQRGPPRVVVRLRALPRPPPKEEEEEEEYEDDEEEEEEEEDGEGVDDV